MAAKQLVLSFFADEPAADAAAAALKERPRRVVRFARLIHRRVRDLGGP